MSSYIIIINNNSNGSQDDANALAYRRCNLLEEATIWWLLLIFVWALVCRVSEGRWQRGRQYSYVRERHGFHVLHGQALVSRRRLRRLCLMIGRVFSRDWLALHVLVAARYALTCGGKAILIFDYVVGCWGNP